MNFELFFAETVAGDSKDAACPTDSSCARLQYYSWEKRRAVTVVLDRAAATIVHTPSESPRPYLTQLLKERAATIALSDSVVQDAAGTNARAALVVDVSGYGSCETNLCAVVSVIVTDGTMAGRSQALGVQVDLHREAAVLLVADGEVLIDRRFN